MASLVSYLGVPEGDLSHLVKLLLTGHLVLTLPVGARKHMLRFISSQLLFIYASLIEAGFKLGTHLAPAVCKARPGSVQSGYCAQAAAQRRKNVSLALSHIYVA